MPIINQIRTVSTPADVLRAIGWLPLLTLFVLSAAIAATAAAAMAATSVPDATARYQAERAVCLSGQSNQDRATCLREAGAALQEARNGRLQEGRVDYRQNASVRCNALPADDRDACLRRMAGEGTTSGSALEGGVTRELVVPTK